LFLIPVSFLAACGSRKETGGSKNMQNLTARFNILYNANQQFNDAQAAVFEELGDDYSRILPVYKEPQKGSSISVNRALDSVILRADAIIGEKSRSDYVDDAWMLKGRVNYLRADFFNAAEFFDYVYKNWYDDKLLRQEALFWKARSLMRLDDKAGAAVALDSALKHLFGPDHAVAGVYAAEAQFNILSGNTGHAADMLKKALQLGSSRQNTLRWKYVLAQLEEELGHRGAADELYTAIVKSNAPFVMAFNASLSRLRLLDAVNPASAEEKIAALQSLAKPYKNRDFLDQVYYRIGEIYLLAGQTESAIQNFRFGLDKSTVNRNQKGLIYLKLADIYFKDADYVQAKSYYDSTLAVLSPDFPGYAGIRTKSANLDFLATRFREIAKQDTLQMLAQLSEPELQSRISALVRDQLRKTGAHSAYTQEPGPFVAAIDLPGSGNNTGGKFYFSNVRAISQGLADFKKKWGSRKLDDNWRRSGRSSDIQPVQLSDNPPELLTVSQQAPPLLPEERMSRELMNEIPRTVPMINASENKEISAYYEIAGFYKDDLGEPEEAIRIYELLLEQFPENSYKASIYFNLYRLLETNPVQAALYRGKLLKEFPESLFAKVVLDAAYAEKPDQRTAGIHKAYAAAYTAYAMKNYHEVAAMATQARQQFGINSLSPQFDYLAALAIGHLRQIGILEDSLRNIATAYPADSIVVPLIRQQLNFIKANRKMLEQRTVALIDPGAGGPTAGFPDIEPTLSPITAKNKPADNPVGKQPENAAANAAALQIMPETAPVAENKTELAVNKPALLYDLPEKGEYYVVINVTDGSLNLNPSRFGLGQYIRSNYTNTGIKHQTKELGSDNQLVYVGKLTSRAEALAFRLRIMPLLKDIMKIPAEKYDTFVITGSGLEKLNSRTEVERYADFFRNLHD
jgi:tetratricopeptide (TPR) repeat protein